jgi:hypothetical protein
MEMGAVGALLTLFFVQIFPAGFALWFGASMPRLTIPRLVGAAIIVSGFVFAGAVAGLKGHPTNRTDAFFYGMACQTLLAGFAKAGNNTIQGLKSGGE